MWMFLIGLYAGIVLCWALSERPRVLVLLPSVLILLLGAALAWGAVTRPGPGGAYPETLERVIDSRGYGVYYRDKWGSGDAQLYWQCYPTTQQPR